MSLLNQNMLSNISKKTYVVGIIWALPTSTHNICFHLEIQKFVIGVPHFPTTIIIYFLDEMRKPSFWIPILCWTSAQR